MKNNHKHLRKQIWTDAFLDFRTAALRSGLDIDPAEFADQALEEFDKRFKFEPLKKINYAVEFQKLIGKELGTDNIKEALDILKSIDLDLKQFKNICISLSAPNGEEAIREIQFLKTSREILEKIKIDYRIVSNGVDEVNLLSKNEIKL